ncbi:GNAT family N-acetyltransferase [Streptoalloteichus tenebrarius]|uniref:GNAT family N-acetyltransferase n=1 Tax=Streptoalloteichus tenebrarius (strain ATCC 17920 / DSM 40477 / JCM 4838 / CBS 697.72 / NBRC 16177 / NCIMB 11028 / NRRL B-12390 / A12253. 1 / ISP 5477) TaxID=1933 RepID=UPI0020A2C706|nr:GNAT family N-acetyltransferase [Streptoalloteichus tenebrarius]
MRILSFPEAETPPELRDQVIELQHEAWPGEAVIPPLDPAERGGRVVTHDPALNPRSMLLVDDGVVLAALDILTKEIAHAGQHYRAGGLGSVVTRRSVRGRGYGRRLVTATRETMAASGLDVGVFTCARPVRRFYESAGWHLFPGAVLVGGTREAPYPSDQPHLDAVVMGDFFSPRARENHLSFHNARIELYSGEIDKLW